MICRDAFRAFDLESGSWRKYRKLFVFILQDWHRLLGIGIRSLIFGAALCVGLLRKETWRSTSSFVPMKICRAIVAMICSMGDTTTSLSESISLSRLLSLSMTISTTKTDILCWLVLITMISFGFRMWKVFNLPAQTPANRGHIGQILTAMPRV